MTFFVLFTIKTLDDDNGKYAFTRFHYRRGLAGTAPSKIKSHKSLNLFS